MLFLTFSRGRRYCAGKIIPSTPEDALLMSLQKRLTGLLGIILLMTFALSSAASYRHIKNNKLREVRRLAEQVRGILMATRQVYHQQFLTSGIPLTPETLGFLPSHALSLISEEFSNWSDFSMTFNNVSERARNPNNSADSHELENIAFFHNNPEQTVRLRKVTDSQGKQYYHYVRPIRVEEYCLKCHGKKEEAPLTIQTVYQNAFDYQVGELRSIMSIKIGENETAQQIITFVMINLLVHGLIFIILFRSIQYLFQRFLISPLTRLDNALSILADGESSKTLEGLGEDFTAIENTVNTLAKRTHKTSL